MPSALPLAVALILPAVPVAYGQVPGAAAPAPGRTTVAEMKYGRVGSPVYAGRTTDGWWFTVIRTARQVDPKDDRGGPIPAEDSLKRAWKAGDAHAGFVLAEHHEARFGYRGDHHDQAKKLWREAAKRGHEWAMIRVVYWDRDYRWLEPLASSAWPHARFQAGVTKGWLYQESVKQGRPDPALAEEARRLIRSALEAGDLEGYRLFAQYDVQGAFLFSEGERVALTRHFARFPWIWDLATQVRQAHERGGAAEVRRAMGQVGPMLDDEWLLDVADKYAAETVPGFAEACIARFPSVCGDSAVGWLRRVDSLDPDRGAYGLSLAHAFGVGVPRDSVRAFQELWRAYEKERAIPAYLPLANRFLAGNGTPVDTAAALAVLEAAVRAGVPNARAKLAPYYFYGWGGVTTDWYRARELTAFGQAVTPLDVFTHAIFDIELGDYQTAEEYLAAARNDPALVPLVEKVRTELRSRPDYEQRMAAGRLFARNYAQRQAEQAAAQAARERRVEAMRAAERAAGAWSALSPSSAASTTGLVAAEQCGTMLATVSSADASARERIRNNFCY
ncbi:MAG TPA: hypothetical protein VNK43_07480 [Gemmatimonadales bacterium]|nr:hypothetical protein [Gemmatimonadales bacterium]